MEYRVSTISGDLPIIVVAPHGPDDENTDRLAEIVAEQIDAYAVINHGWRRGPDVDIWNDKANCNNIKHLHEDVVKEEFLDPIFQYVSRCQRDYGFALIFILHGMGNYVRIAANDSKLDAIVGYGNGHPPSYSCHPRLKDVFIYHLAKAGITAYEGKANGQFAGKDKNNLNQLHRRWYPNNDVHSLQIEIVHELREDEDMCKLTGEALASAMEELVDVDDTTDVLINTLKF